MDSRPIAVSAEAITALCDLLQACVAGKSLDHFRKNLRLLVDEHGWDWFVGDGDRDFNQRARWLYRAVSASRYAATRRAQLLESAFPLWMFCAGHHCGELHQRFDRIVLPPDHPFWRAYPPPLGWGCDCYIVGGRSQREIVRLGGDPDRPLPDGWDRPDPATGLHPGVERLWDRVDPPDLLDLLAAIVDGEPPAID